MRLWICLLLLVAHPASARAGAWMQAVGAGFAAGSLTLRDNSTAELGLFADYGLTERLSVGLDVNQNNDKFGHALIFARTPLTKVGDKGRLAVQIAVGAHSTPEVQGAMVRAGLLYGRSMGHNGWFGFEATLEHRAGLNEPVLKLDSVAGLPTRSNLQLMIKSESYLSRDMTVGWSVSPQVIVRGKGKSSWVVGAEYREGGGTSTMGLSLGLWHKF